MSVNIPPWTLCYQGREIEQLNNDSYPGAGWVQALTLALSQQEKKPTVRVCLKWMRAVGMTSSTVAATTHTILSVIATQHYSPLMTIGRSFCIFRKTSISTLLHVRLSKSFFPLQWPGSLYGLINNVVMSVKGDLERTVGHVVQTVLTVLMVVCLAKLPSDIYHEVYQINIACTPRPQSNTAVLVGPLSCDNWTLDLDKCLENYLWDKAHEVNPCFLIFSLTIPSL